jgi:hypothetical protein
MRSVVFLGLSVFYVIVHAVAQTPPPPRCAPDEILVPITYSFRDTDVQYAWAYHALHPTLTTSQAKHSPKSMNVVDGSLSMSFCIRMPVTHQRLILRDGPDVYIRTPATTERLILRVGPRVYDLVVRPITKNARGASEMSPLILVGQPRPDWVVVKSFERLQPESARLPSFELELFNFGQAHPGGHVQFESFEHGRACAFPSPPIRVTVQVSLSGQRLRIATSDPEYPEELVLRQAELNTHECRPNFTLRASFGPTGRLPPGPTRIRYTLREATVTQSRESRPDNPNVPSLLSNEEIEAIQTSGIEQYFQSRGYHLKVVGEGIW